jgi:hypothetical protein
MKAGIKMVDYEEVKVDDIDDLLKSIFETWNLLIFNEEDGVAPIFFTRLQ